MRTYLQGEELLAFQSSLILFRMAIHYRKIKLIQDYQGSQCPHLLFGIWVQGTDRVGSTCWLEFKPWSGPWIVLRDRDNGGNWTIYNETVVCLASPAWVPRKWNVNKFPEINLWALHERGGQLWTNQLWCLPRRSSDRMEQTLIRVNVLGTTHSKWLDYFSW